MGMARLYLVQGPVEMPADTVMSLPESADGKRFARFEPEKDGSYSFAAWSDGWRVYEGRQWTDRDIEEGRAGGGVRIGEGWAEDDPMSLIAGLISDIEKASKDSARG